jgi:hypothetical protein
MAGLVDHNNELFPPQDAETWTRVRRRALKINSVNGNDVHIRCESTLDCVNQFRL